MSEITIISHKRSNNFTIVPNHIINASYLKLEDKAFLIWVLSKPEDWKLNTLSLAKIHGVCKDKITTISKRLQRYGHLIIIKGAYGKAKWMVFENPEDSVNVKEKYQNTSPDPILTPYPEKQDVIHPEIHDPEKQDALLRTDLLPRTELKDLCPSDDRPIDSIVDNSFKTLWNAWPNTKQRLKAVKSFKTVLRKEKIKAPDSIKEFSYRLVDDIQERLRLTGNRFDDGFRNSMLSTYLNNNGWEEDMPEKPINIANTDEAKAANDRKSRELFGIKR